LATSSAGAVSSSAGGLRWTILAAAISAGQRPWMHFGSTGPCSMTWSGSQRSIAIEDADMFGMGMYEMMIIGVVAIVLFGAKLPEVARSVGASYHEFRKGLNEIHSQVSTSYSTSYDTKSYMPTATEDAPHEHYDDHEEATAPRFDPPPQD
jgi:sec-independent protein translocase protein TatA